MDKIMLVIMLAVTVEAIIEYVKTFFDGSDISTIVIRLAAIAVSIGLCVAAGADFYAALGIDFAVPYIGTVLTGIFASRGANFVSDLVSKLQGSSDYYE